MNKKHVQFGHKKWSVETGDYQRDFEDTRTYQKQKTIRRVKITSIVVFAICAITAISYFYLVN